MSSTKLSNDERQKILVEWNSTEHEFPENKCLHQLFESHVKGNPDATALFYRGEKYSYAVLNNRANQLANYLIKLGFGPDSLVGICTDRSIEMVVGIMGVLKAGAAYVPVDPSYPKSRVRFMLEDTRVSTLLTQAHLIDELPDLDAKLICLDRDWSEIANESVSQPDTGVNSENLCYVIYTSGSTGQPKGISLRHKGVVNNIYDLNNSFNIGSEARIIAISALGFDMCVYEVLGTLAAGGAIVMPEQWGLKDPAHWADLVKQHGVTVWNSAPALLEMIVDYIEPRPDFQPAPIKVVIQGGDWMPVSLPDRLRAIAPEAVVVVLGGATEASIHSIVYVVDKVDPGWKSIPYGRPMRNQKAYILDEEQNPLPIGEPGELHLGGIGLARGYFDRVELTEEKFIPNPFVVGERIYRTGDLARWREDGNIDLVGRIDFQVKIRGHRIELGEITSCLEEHSDVQQAIVVMREDEPGEKRLVAYVIPRDTNEPDEPASQGNEQVGQWEEVYDQTYAEESHAGSSMNFIGWNSSYTGEPFPDEELNEMLGFSVDRVLALKPECAYEIGCGTGLILLNVAPHTKQYHAADLSKVAIEALQKKVDADSGHFGSVELNHTAATEFSVGDGGSYDTVILNSVLQHFPEVNYLSSVIDVAVDAIQESGTFFIGDVRNLALLESFHTSIECFMADSKLPISKLQQKIQRRMRNEKELVVDPEYFLTLPEQNSRVSNSCVLLKRGQHYNEFNKYHYEVYLRIGAEKNKVLETSVFTWNRDVSSLEDIKRLVSEGSTPVVRIQRISNARSAKDLKLLRTLADSDGLGNVGDLLDLNDTQPDISAIDPEAIWALGAELPYQVELCLAESDDEGRYDAVFLHKDLADSVSMIELLSESSNRKLARKADYFYANQPFQEKTSAGLVPSLRASLQQNLPEYMVPKDIMLLARMPLTPNGKVDRRALPIPDNTRPDLEENYVAPVNAVQTALVILWSEVLELDKIGIQDSFFALGGHSLKATQIATRINETFEIHVGINNIFEEKTIENLAAVIGLKGKHDGVDVQAIAETVVELSQLSENEIQAMLE